MSGAQHPYPHPQNAPSANQARQIDPARARQVELILERVDALPTLSPVAARLLKLGTTDGVDINEVIRIIETDPALSTRIIGLCRKADRGLGDRITTVKRAVLMLGLESVRSVALSVSIYDLMSGENDQARRDLDAAVAQQAPESEHASPGFDRKGFWKHSIAVACAAEAVAAQHAYLKVLPEEAFLAGLLHDIGKLALELILPRSYERVIRLAERRLSDAGAIERSVIGIDHHTAGKRVAEHWELPETLQNVVWLHGQPFKTLPKAADVNLIGIVTVAKGLCRQMHLGWSGDFGPLPDVDRHWREVGLGPAGPTSIAGPLQAALADRLKVLGLDDAASPGILVEALANANRQLSAMNTALRDRARQSLMQARVLDSITAFLATDPLRRSMAETIALVVASSAQTMGPGYFAALFRAEAGEPWQVCTLNGEGSPAAIRVVAEPKDPARVDAWLKSLASGTQMNMAVLGMLPWLAEHLTGIEDQKSLRLLAITSAVDHQAGPVAILINDRELAEQGLGQAQLAPLVAAWSAAIRTVSDRAHASRLGEQLVESSRAMAEMQARLTDQESLARLGEVTAGAAHEMNNPLTVIAGHAQLLVARLENEKDRAAASVISRAAGDLSKLIESLHLLSNTPEVRAGACDLKGLVSRCMIAARKRAGMPCAIDVEVGAAPATVMVDPELFCGVLTELITNAAEANPHGLVTVTAAVERNDERLVIMVKDTGPGLSIRAKKHAFDPFFSERPAGRGRGLGLTRARCLSDAMGGTITLDSAPGTGTLATFSIGDWRGAARAAA